MVDGSSTGSQGTGESIVGSARVVRMSIPSPGRDVDDEGAAMQAHSITMLGTGLIGDFYTNTLHGQRGSDRVASSTRAVEERGALRRAVGRPGVGRPTSGAVEHPETDVVVMALPNHLHEEAVASAAAAGKAVLCTKPLGRNAAEARRMLDAVERAGVFGGYLEDLCYTPKTLKAIRSVEGGAVGEVTWVRSRETHPGPHSAWFWDGRMTGGGAIIDLGCHCIEIIRNFVGKGNRPVEVLVPHRYARPSHRGRGQRDRAHPLRVGRHRPVRGVLDVPRRHGPARRGRRAPHGTIWLNHFLRTGFEMFTAGGSGGYVAEKAETRPAGCSRWATRSPSWATSTCSPTCSRSIDGGRRRGRRSTTAMS